MSTKNKFGIGMLFLAMLVISIALIPAVSAQEASSNGSQYTDTTNSVGIDKAKEVASFSIKDISGSISGLSKWKDATVELSTIYYDLDDNKSAYLFDVIENGQYAGYIIISATKKNYPVLEFSDGKAPNAVPKLAARSKSLAIEHANKTKLESTSKKELTIGEMKPLYLGPTYFYAEYPLTDTNGKIRDNVIVDLTSSAILDLNQSHILNQSQANYPLNEQTLLKQQQIREQDAGIKWKSIEERMNTETISNQISSASSSLGYIYNVPFYTQDQTGSQGCSPTAAAMVLGYWRAKGYSNFPSSGQTLVTNLANAMKTSPSGSTWPWFISGGINSVCNNYGYGSWSSSDIPGWDNLKAEVNAQRPFVLSMWHGGTGSGRTQPYGDHSTTCVGYAEDPTYKYLFLHDTWSGSQHHYISFGDWWAYLITWVRPS